MMTSERPRIADIALALKKAASIAIFPHVGVDADCIGAGLALKSILEKTGKQVFIFSDTVMAERFSFLPGSETFEIYDGSIDPAEYLYSKFDGTGVDFGILEDCSSKSRIGKCAELLELCSNRIIIDHHHIETIPDGLTCIYPDACATGELLYQLITEYERITGQELMDSDIAKNIISAIYFDTGALRYSNTNSNAFQIAGDLFARFAIDIKDISYNLFEKSSKSRVCIHGIAFSNVEYHANDKIAIVVLSKENIAECDALDDDMDGICAELRNVEGVEVAFMLREKPNGEIRGNIRSTDLFDSASFAAAFGGGGHKRAAGFTLTGISLISARKLIIDESVKMLSTRGAEIE